LNTSLAVTFNHFSKNQTNRLSELKRHPENNPHRNVNKRKDLTLECTANSVMLIRFGTSPFFCEIWATNGISAPNDRTIFQSLY